MHITKNSTVAQLLAESPSLSSIFHAFGIDFCCGVDRTLEDACRVQCLPVDVLLHALENATQDRDTLDRNWLDASLADLTRHIVRTYHEPLRKQLPELSANLQRITQVHGTCHPELKSLLLLFQTFRQQLEMHMQKEETVLFPASMLFATRRNIAHRNKKPGHMPPNSVPSGFSGRAKKIEAKAS